jgi:FkbM family methyltransferase
MLRNMGIRSFCQTIFVRTRLKVEINLRGRNRVVSIDGCSFDLSNIPDTEMKLELLTGDYEEPERSAARRFIHTDWPVVELGACIGVVACVTNKLLSNPKAHVVLEASPISVPHLKSNRDANHCSFTIVNKALAYNTDKVTFVPQEDFWRNHLDHDGTRPPVTVEAIQLRKILSDNGFEKFALICDIEGREYDLVMHEEDALRKAEVIIMEVHPYMIGEEKIKILLSKLADWGFKTVEKSKLVVVLNRA